MKKLIYAAVILSSLSAFASSVGTFYVPQGISEDRVGTMIPADAAGSRVGTLNQAEASGFIALVRDSGAQVGIMVSFVDGSQQYVEVEATSIDASLLNELRASPGAWVNAN